MLETLENHYEVESRSSDSKQFGCHPLGFCPEYRGEIVLISHIKQENTVAFGAVALPPQMNLVRMAH